MVTHSNLFFLTFVADGDENEENLCGWPLGAHHTGGCQKLLRTVRSGKFPSISI